MKALACWAALALFILLAFSPVWAHGSHDAKIRIRHEGEVLQLSFMIDGADLAQFDRNGDGKLTRAEAGAEMPAIAREIDSCLDARNADDRLLELRQADNPIPRFAALRPSDRVERMRILREWRMIGPGPARVDFGCFLKAHPERRGLLVKAGSASLFGVSRRAPVLRIE